MDRDWHRSFFSGVVVDMWRAAAPPEQTRAEADFLERELRLRPGARQRVLDVPCGFGRHALELAGRGHALTGVDQSAEMLEAAQALAAQAGAQAGARVEWRQSEMRELPWTAEFDAAFCFGNSFGYLDRDGTRAFLAALARALKPGARFAFDYGTAAECILPRFEERHWAPVGDLYFLEHNRYDPVESCIETTYTFVRDGASETRTGLQWVFTVAEVRAMLAEAGFAVLSQHGSCEGRPFELGATILVVVAEKPAQG
ncbi:MAG TPA: class I SAM-dependent methyltransferase [Planctomycetota bacterium]|nr:class I SAM-dependent methyltransferase [Planctomycetota bacterium]